LVQERILRWFPPFQVASTCFSCSPSDLNSVVTNCFLSYYVKWPLPPGDNPTAVNKYYYYHLWSLKGILNFIRKDGKKQDEILWADSTEAAEYKTQHNECNSHSRVLQYNFTIKWQFSSPCYLHSSYKLSSITRAAWGRGNCRDSGRQTCGLRREGALDHIHNSFIYQNDKHFISCYVYSQLQTVLPICDGWRHVSVWHFVTFCGVSVYAVRKWRCMWVCGNRRIDCTSAAIILT